MTKCRLRLILLGLLFVTLFLPVDPEVPTNWFFSFWSLLLFLAAIPDLIANPSISRLLFGVGSLLYFFAIQILILFNLCLCCSACLRKLERLYRISLIVLFFVVWWFVLFIVDPYRGIGYWANPVMVTVAALLEIGFVMHERSRKPLNLNP
ncbi:MAG: hypothetical protein ACP5J4_19550 [Anaerolineae bacterium]